MTETTIDNLKLLDTIVVNGQSYAVTEIMFMIETIRVTANRLNTKQIDELRKLAWNKLGICASCLKDAIS